MHWRARRVVVIATVAVVLAVSLAWFVLSHREPVYRGKPLTAWAQQYGSNRWTINRASADEAEFAIRQIGTNSVPYMIDLMRATDTSLKKRLRKMLPGGWHGPLHLKDESGNIRRIGAHAIAALGTNAPSAVRPLIELGKTHPEPDGRYIAVFALRTLGSAAEAAVPFYIQCLTNADATIRNEAAVGLALIPQQWPTALPHLIKYLESIKEVGGWESRHLVELFGSLGTNAQPAMPILLTMWDYPDTSVREALTNALPRIDPEAAAKAGLNRR